MAPPLPASVHSLTLCAGFLGKKKKKKTLERQATDYLDPAGVAVRSDKFAVVRVGGCFLDVGPPPADQLELARAGYGEEGWCC